MKEGRTTVRGKGEGRNKKVRSCAATLEHNVSFAQLIFLSTTTFIMYIFFIQGIFKPMNYVGVTANVMHVGINILLIQGIDIGFR